MNKEKEYTEDAAIAIKEEIKISEVDENLNRVAEELKQIQNEFNILQNKIEPCLSSASTEDEICESSMCEPVGSSPLVHKLRDLEDRLSNFKYKIRVVSSWIEL